MFKNIIYSIFVASSLIASVSASAIATVEALPCSTCQTIINVSMKTIQGAIQSAPSQSAEIIEKELNSVVCPLLKFFVSQEECKEKVRHAVTKVEKIEHVRDFNDFSESVCATIKLCDSPCEKCIKAMTADLTAALEKAKELTDLCKLSPVFLYDSCMEKAKEAIDLAK
eukprot:Awhi_evm1s5494